VKTGNPELDFPFSGIVPHSLDYRKKSARRAVIFPSRMPGMMDMVG